MRFFFTCSQLLTVLYWLVPIIGRVCTSFTNLAWKSSFSRIVQMAVVNLSDPLILCRNLSKEHISKKCVFIEIVWTSHLRLFAISKQIELESWIWSWIVDNLIQFHQKVKSTPFHNFLWHFQVHFEIQIAFCRG